MRCSMGLTVISGPVFFCLTDAMILDRTSGVRLSTTYGLYGVTEDGATTRGLDQTSSNAAPMCRGEEKLNWPSRGLGAGARLGRMLLYGMGVRWQSGRVAGEQLERRELPPPGVAQAAERNRKA